jgi:hypothetical protein
MINFIQRRWQHRLIRPDSGSVTIENVIWALAVIVIAGIVVAAITAYVTNHANGLLGP